jgi:GNAT superfamily N-acetyltransferase
MNYELHDDMTTAEAEYVQRKLLEFSDGFTEPRNYREFGVALRDQCGEVVGGITANRVWDWLQIGVLWIPDELRGQGLGQQLLKRMENLGRQHGCKFAKLDTFEFEAREFYESHGYTVQSRTDNFPRDHTQFHLTKEL